MLNLLNPFFYFPPEYFCISSFFYYIYLKKSIENLSNGDVPESLREHNLMNKIEILNAKLLR